MPVYVLHAEVFDRGNVSDWHEPGISQLMALEGEEKYREDLCLQRTEQRGGISCPHYYVVKRQLETLARQAGGIFVSMSSPCCIRFDRC